MNCKQATGLVSQSLDRKLSLAERLALRFHLFICKACSAFKLQLIQMCSALKVMVQNTEQNTSLELSDEARRHIERAIDLSKQ